MCRQRQAAERADRERQEQREAEEAERRRKMNPKEKGFRCVAGVQHAVACGEAV